MYFSNYFRMVGGDTIAIEVNCQSNQPYCAIRILYAKCLAECGEKRSGNLEGARNFCWMILK